VNVTANDLCYSRAPWVKRLEIKMLDASLSKQETRSVEVFLKE
jgi:hypothetical protein